MSRTSTFSISPGWQVLLTDLGLNPDHVLRRAGLPTDLFRRPDVRLESASYFRLWQAIADESDDPTLPIRIGDVISAEVFDPPLFAAICSPNLRLALERIGRFKPLIGPMALHVESRADTLQVEIQWLLKSLEPPAVLAATELVFFVRLARLATRTTVQPLRITSPNPPTPAEAYTEYFGVQVQQAPEVSLTFSRIDAERPFLTENPQMWSFFEPQLQRRLSQLDADATPSDRVRGVLLELLPTGQCSIEVVAQKLAMSPRSLQRHLSRDGQTFQKILSSTRQDLASHYLKRSSFSGAEISLLLGFEDSSSFFRAFKSWTGDTPESFRSAAAN